MKKITQILEAKNVELYNNGCIKSIDSADNFLLKFNTEDGQDLEFILDKKYNNNFIYGINKEYVDSNIYTDSISIQGDYTQSFAIIGVEYE